MRHRFVLIFIQHTELILIQVAIYPILLYPENTRVLENSPPPPSYNPKPTPGVHIKSHQSPEDLMSRPYQSPYSQIQPAPKVDDMSYQGVDLTAEAGQSSTGISWQ
jgi:hypothetical protein